MYSTSGIPFVGPNLLHGVCLMVTLLQSAVPGLVAPCRLLRGLKGTFCF